MRLQQELDAILARRCDLRAYFERKDFAETIDMRTPRERYLRMRLEGKTPARIHAIAAGRDDTELLRWLQNQEEVQQAEAEVNVFM